VSFVLLSFVIDVDMLLMSKSYEIVITRCSEPMTATVVRRSVCCLATGFVRICLNHKGMSAQCGAMEDSKGRMWWPFATRLI
jgi:hypothetical protein